MMARTIALGEIMAARSRTVDPTKHPDEAFELYSIPAFDKGTADIVAGKDIGSAKQVVEPGDVLLSRIVPHIRRGWIVGPSKGHRILASSEWIVFRGRGVHQPYLRHVLVSDAFHAAFMQTVSGVGGSLLRARPSYVAQIEIPFPLVEKQRRIAEILDKADLLRAKRRATIAQLDTLKQSIFLDMFGDPAANPMSWPVLELGRLFESPALYGTMIPATPDGGDWLSLRVTNIQDWKLDLSDQKFVDLPAKSMERHSVRDGDLLLARAIASREHLGKAVIARPGAEKWAFDSHLMRLRIDQELAFPEVVRQMLMTEGGRRLFLKVTRRSAVQFNINTKEISALRIPMPPFELQAEFVRRLRYIEGVGRQAGRMSEQFDALVASLQHRAFRGEL